MAATSFTGLLLLLLLSSVASVKYYSTAGASLVPHEIGDLATASDHRSGAVQEHHAGSSSSSTVAWSKVLRGRKMGSDVGSSTATAAKKEKKSTTTSLRVITTSEVNGAKKLPEACSEVASRIFSWCRSYIIKDNQQDTIAYTETTTRRRSLLRLRLLPNAQEQEHLHGSTSEAEQQQQHYYHSPSLEPAAQTTHHNNLVDAATEISMTIMLSKDYGHKPRSRSPVHNQHHLDHHDNAKIHP